MTLPRLDPSLSSTLPAAKEIGRGIITGAKEPQRSYMWEIFIKDKESESADRKPSNLMFFAKNCSIPASTIEPIRRNYMGETFNLPGNNNSPKLFRVTFWDDKSLIVYRYFQRWMNLCADPMTGRQADYKRVYKDFRVVLKDTTDFFVSSDFILKDCFPTEIVETSLSYYENDIMTFDVAFMFNHKIMNGETYEGIEG